MTNELENTLTELINDYNISRKDLRQGFINADKIVDFVAYMLDIEHDDYANMGKIMEIYYVEYFNQIANDAFIKKAGYKQKNKPHQVDFYIEELYVNSDCKKDIIDTLKCHCNKDKAWAFNILYEVFNGTVATEREA